jgi:hypothetical protein
MIWIEHYAPDRTLPETYNLVAFQKTPEGFADPEWEELTSDQVRQLVEEDRI